MKKNLHIVVMNRTLVETPESPFARHKAEPFGSSFLISIPPKSFSLDLLHKEIAASLKGCSYSKDDRPFSIHIVSERGKGCGICPWPAYCLGCTLGSEDQLPTTSNVLYLALQWSKTSKTMFYVEPALPVTLNTKKAAY